ncbi:MAG: DUF1559 domain-containing protein [Planctomycetaceae bacterium]
MKIVLCVVVALLAEAVHSATVMAQDDSVQAYVTDDFVVGLALRPARLLKSDFVTTLLDAAGLKDALPDQMEHVQQAIGFDPRHAVEVVMLLDKRTILEMAGLPESVNDKAATNDKAELKTDENAMSRATLTGNLKQLGLAMHNFHDVYGNFADDNGGAGAAKGKLSWRVHLLPYLDEAVLYRKFRLDEAWDSDHNKTLIEEMPAVFRSPGVAQKGQTSIHILVGEGALFEGERAPALRDIHDGTSNTLLMVMAGADKADVWTKPGGLELKAGAPKNTLGQIDRQFMVCMADGFVRPLSVDLDPDLFRRIAQHQDGEPTSLDAPTDRARRLPTWMVRTDKEIDRGAVFNALEPMGNAVAVDSPEGTIHTYGHYAFTFRDRKTLLAAPSDLLHVLLKSAAGSSSEMAARLKTGASKNDVFFVADLRSLAELKKELAGNLPMAGIVQSIDVLEVSLDISGSSDSVQQIRATMQNAASAAQVAALLNGLLQMQKAQVMQISNNPASPIPARAMATFAKLMETTEIQTDGITVTYRTPKPRDMKALAEELRPAARKIGEQIDEAFPGR